MNACLLATFILISKKMESTIDLSERVALLKSYRMSFQQLQSFAKFCNVPLKAPKLKSGLIKTIAKNKI